MEMPPPSCGQHYPCFLSLTQSVYYFKKKKKNTTTTITSLSLGVYASATSTVAFSFDFSSASPEVNYCPIWTSQVAKFIYSP
jgi:hypothetical protein